MIKRILLGVIVFSSLTIKAQSNSASPYSFFGIGENFESVTVEQASMGGIGVALKDVNHLNFTNPAANADLRYATYALGGSLTFLTLKESNSSQSGNSTNLRYIALGFPIGKKAGFSVGLQPFSSVGYSLLNESETETSLFRGTGGTNKIYASFGMYAIEGLSFGAEASFIFGNIENSIVNQKQDVVLATKNEEDLNIRGGQLKLGTHYKTTLKNKLELSTGIALTLASDLTARGTDRLFSLSYGGSGQEIPRDTIFNSSTKGSITIPLKTAIGFGLGKTNKWYVGVNQEYQSALTSDNSLIADASSYRYDDSSKFSIGGYFIPKINSISSYWNRVTYRAGLRFEDTGLLVNNSGGANNFTAISDFGINLGLGLPMPRQLSNVNIGFEYGQRGTTNNNLIKENYFNVRLSLSLNSLNWFQKRQID